MANEVYSYLNSGGITLHIVPRLVTSGGTKYFGMFPVTINNLIYVTLTVHQAGIHDEFGGVIPENFISLHPGDNRSIFPIVPTGQYFTGWTGGGGTLIISEGDSVTMLYTNAEYTANFLQYLSVSVVGGSYGSGTNYQHNQAISIVAATPSSGYGFSHWSGDVSGVLDVNSSTTTLQLTNTNVTVYANYSLIAPSVQVITDALLTEDSLNYISTEDGINYIKQE
jgi:hypothetical protein